MAGFVGFIVNLIALLAAGAIFFISIDKVAPDAFFAKVAKIAVGALLLIALVVTVASAFGFASGIVVSPIGVVYFAIAVIIAVAVLYIINMVVDWLATQVREPTWAVPVKYVLGVIVLIGLLIAAANLLFGVRGAGPFRFGATTPTTLTADAGHLR